MTRLFSLTLLLPIALCGQQKLCMKASAGISRISLRNIGNTSSETEPGFSKQIGIYYSIGLGKHSSLESGINLSHLSGKEKITFYSPRSSHSLEKYAGTVKLKYTLSCFSLPVYYNISFKKLDISLGYIAGIVISEIIDQETTHDPYALTLQTDRLQVNQLYAGFGVSLTYPVYKHFHVQGFYNYGTSNFTYKRSGSVPCWKIQELVFGVCYDFRS